MNSLQASRQLYSDKKLFDHMVGQSCGLQIDMYQVSIPANELCNAVDDLSLLIRKTRLSLSIGLLISCSFFSNGFQGVSKVRCVSFGRRGSLRDKIVVAEVEVFELLVAAEHLEHL